MSRLQLDFQLSNLVKFKTPGKPFFLKIKILISNRVYVLVTQASKKVFIRRMYSGKHISSFVCLFSVWYSTFFILSTVKLYIVHAYPVTVSGLIPTYRFFTIQGVFFYFTMYMYETCNCIKQHQVRERLFQNTYTLIIFLTIDWPLYTLRILVVFSMQDIFQRFSFLGWKNVQRPVREIIRTVKSH